MFRPWSNNVILHITVSTVHHHTCVSEWQRHLKLYLDAFASKPRLPLLYQQAVTAACDGNILICKGDRLVYPF